MQVVQDSEMSQDKPPSPPYTTPPPPPVALIDIFRHAGMHVVCGVYAMRGGRVYWIASAPSNPEKHDLKHGDKNYNMNISLRTDTPLTGASLRVLLVEIKLSANLKQKKKEKHCVKRHGVVILPSEEGSARERAHLSKSSPIYREDVHVYKAIRAKSEESWQSPNRRQEKGKDKAAQRRQCSVWLFLADLT